MYIIRECTGCVLSGALLLLALSCGSPHSLVCKKQTPPKCLVKISMLKSIHTLMSATKNWTDCKKCPLTQNISDSPYKNMCELSTACPGCQSQKCPFCVRIVNNKYIPLQKRILSWRHYRTRFAKALFRCEWTVLRSHIGICLNIPPAEIHQVLHTHQAKEIPPASLLRGLPGGSSFKS